jgi:hypothetical protein
MNPPVPEGLSASADDSSYFCAYRILSLKEDLSCHFDGIFFGFIGFPDNCGSGGVIVIFV